MTELASRSTGVTGAELAADFGIPGNHAIAYLATAARRLGWARVKERQLGGTRFFVDETQATRWAALEVARLGCTLRALERVGATGKPAARPVKPTPAAPVAKPAAAPMPAAQAIKPAPAPAAVATAPAAAETTAATVYTTATRRPESHRIDLRADPLPGVPGWGRGPVLREGARDYRRHQAHSQAGGAA
jgi:hypothetical protein